MCNDCKATLLAYNNTNQVVAANSTISTPITSIEGCGIKFNNAATITRAGTYLVNISANALATTAGDLSLQLVNNGSNVPGAIAVATGTTTGTLNLNVNYLLTVKKSCNCIDNKAVLTLLNSGVGATYSNVVMTIARV
jgi:hypothetical protein